MLDDRKAAILRAVVECHIRTAQPVSSAYVAQLGDLSVSPATVRNDMAVLEQEGYLFQPHSSAGRVPTDKGYRFFVDSLAGPSPLGPVQAELVRMFFARKHGEIERTLAETSGLLSQLTDYAALVVAPGVPEPGRVRSVQLVQLAPRHVLAVAVLSSGHVERRSVEMVVGISAVQVERASAAVAAMLTGGPLDGAGQPVASGDGVVDALAMSAVDAFRSPEPEEAGRHVFVGGAARMAAAFDAVGTIRNVLAILEEQFVLVTLLKDVLDRGLTVAIGAEHGVLPLADCSVVVAPYAVDGERVGTVGVLGPTRMHYDQALAAVAVVSKKLGKALSEGDRARRPRQGNHRSRPAPAVNEARADA
ncbi:MAG TPA: heat-inducible transcriptional repressor HrcA [Acidimicrobiales bacterium]|nr:heat-inducible transcriptional repressor HrcA [Acidimicrobiales bacterium]